MSKLSDIEIIKKYTDVSFTEEELYTNPSTVAQAIIAVTYKVESIERQMDWAVTRLRDLASKVEKNIKAQPGDTVRSLNPIGEVSGSDIGRLDGMIATRHALIEQLQMLVHLSKSA